MRRFLIWLLIALMALQCAAFAETSESNVISTAVNGADAVRTTTDLYFAIPSGEGQMLVRLPLTAGGTPICVDRADDFENLLPYGGGVAYLKTTDGSSAIASCNGNEVTQIYAFGTSTVSDLSYYGGRMLVLMDGMLHSIEPATQLCLRLSSVEMLDYVLGNGYAYFISAGDRMEYTAQLEAGSTTSKQAGCIYRLDLNSGESTLMLKSGGEDLKISDQNLYFHNLADAYAVRTADNTELLGRVYALDVQQMTLEAACTEPDNGFWVLGDQLAIWYNGALNMDTAAGVLALYSPENGSTVVSDGTDLYVWEPGKQTVTQVQTNGSMNTLYTGDLTQAQDASLIVSQPTVDPSASATATANPDTASQGNDAWFEQFMENHELVSGSNSGSQPNPTPIGAPTPTPKPTATPKPTQSSSGSSSSSSSSGSSGSSGSSSSGTTAGSSYNVDTDYVKITGSSVNIRSKATTSSSILGSVKGGTIVRCTGKGSKDSGGSRWYQIKYNGITGWVSASYAKASGAPGSDYVGPEVSESGKYIKIVGGNVTIRSKANKTSSALGYINEGNTATFLGKSSTDARGVKWYKIKYKGTTGWVSSMYAEKTNSSGGSSSGGGSSSSPTKVTIVGGNATIRAKADKTSDALGYINEGHVGTYQGKTSTDSRGVKWYKISYNGVTGWVSSKYSKLS